MSLEDRIKFLMDKEGIDRDTLAEKTGLHAETIARYIRGDRVPNVEILVKMAKALNSSASYLLGETESVQENIAELFSEGKAESVQFVPVVSNKVVVACCGNGSPYASDVQWEIEEMFPVPGSVLMGYGWQGAEFVIMTAEGDSMEPHIKDGDKVLFAKGIEVGLGEIGVFSLDGKLLIRGLIKKNGIYTLKAHNWKAYADLDIDTKAENFFVIGKVLKVVSARSVPPVF